MCEYLQKRYIYIYILFYRLGSKGETKLNETYHKCEQNQLKDFYKNLEKFYKRMYEQARIHAEGIGA